MILEVVECDNSIGDRVVRNPLVDVDRGSIVWFTPYDTLGAAVDSRGDVEDADRLPSYAGEVRSTPGGDFCQTMGCLAGDLSKHRR